MRRIDFARLYLHNLAEAAAMGFAVMCREKRLMTPTRRIFPWVGA